MLNLAAYINSPDRSTKSTTSSFNAFCVLVNTRFQVLFHSPPGVLFTFPSRYFSTIGHQVVFRLGGWSPRLPIGFHVSDGNSGYRSPSSYFAYRTLTVSGRASHPVRLYYEVFISVRTPAVLLLPVWPIPISLATTFGISFDFSSSGYLDVSLPRVPLMHLLIQCMIHDYSSWGLPYSEICG